MKLTSVKDEDIADKILEIENQLTVLEEEKGNLQLRLVDFEDVVTSEKLAKSELNEVSTKLKNVAVELSEASLELEAQRKENAELLKAVEGKHYVFGKKNNQPQICQGESYPIEKF